MMHKGVVTDKDGEDWIFRYSEFSGWGWYCYGPGGAEGYIKSFDDLDELFGPLSWPDKYDAKEGDAL